MFGLAPRATTHCASRRARAIRVSLLPDAGGIALRRLTIAAGGPAALAMPAPARRLLAAVRAAGVPAALSRDAGRYLCNYLCWRAAEAAGKKAGRASPPSSMCRRSRVTRGGRASGASSRSTISTRAGAAFAGRRSRLPRLGRKASLSASPCRPPAPPAESSSCSRSSLCSSRRSSPAPRSMPPATTRARWRDADWSSTGTLPPASDYKPARVIVFTGTAGAWKGIFAVHSWIVLKRDERARLDALRRGRLGQSGAHQWLAAGRPLVRQHAGGDRRCFRAATRKS